MESTTFNTGRVVWIIAATGLCVTLLAFQKQQKPKTQNNTQLVNTDTIPKKKELKIRDLDEALEDMDNVRIDVDMEKMNAELAKIGPEVQKAIAQSRVDVSKAIKDINVSAISQEINAAMEKTDCKEINEEVKTAIDKADWDKIKKEIAEVKLENISVDVEKVNKELIKIKPEIEKAKNELKEYKAFIDGLDKDGLINKKEEYTIKHRNGELIINGKMQPEPVYNKYRSFLEKHKTLNIEKSDDDFNIDND